MKLNKYRIAVAVVAAALCGFPGAAAAITLTFDDTPTLDGYQVYGVTFEGNARILDTGSRVSVLVDPDGWWFSTPDVLCFGTDYCGSETGQILFDESVDHFSIVILSGPGGDDVTSGAGIEAFDAGGSSLAIALAPVGEAYGQLSIDMPGIARVELFTPGRDTWDDLEFSRSEDVVATPEPTTALLLASGCIGLAARARRARIARG